MGGAGLFIEPLIVLTLLFGGTWVNRNTQYNNPSSDERSWGEKIKADAREDPESGFQSSRSSSSGSPVRPSPRNGSPSASSSNSTWRQREIRFLGIRRVVSSPNTRVFKDRLLSRLLFRFPFLVEVWYWALIYWVYQLGRAFAAVTIVEGTIHVARHHALQVIRAEQFLHIFHELWIQKRFLEHGTLLLWINRAYSFIHIPGTILFLVVLFWYTVTRNRVGDQQRPNNRNADGSPAGPNLYEARRRTMAVCNILAFIIFSLWPCMPPRLLSDPNYKGPNSKVAQSYRFVDTVHGSSGKGELSVWTHNRYVNQYAAMPSLHFGYALMIGVTVATIPLSPQHSRASRFRCLPGRISLNRLLCVLAGFSYSFLILVAIVATANHFILDAVAGAAVCALGWWGNRVLLNLLPLEDYFLWCLRMHKPERAVVNVNDEGMWRKTVVQESRR